MLALIFMLLKTEVTCESLANDFSLAIIFNCCFNCVGLFYYGRKDILLLLNLVFGIFCTVALFLDQSGPHLDCQMEPITTSGSGMKIILTMLVLMQNNAVQWLLFKD